MEYFEVLKKYGIGLTGGIATGKSTVAQILRELGYHVVDADKLAREAVAPGSRGLAEVVDKFGASVLTEKGHLDRKKMANIIFDDHDKKEMLESILHPIIFDLLIKNLEENGIIQNPQFWFYEASLLIETGTNNRYREVWCTYCPSSEQLRRLCKRDKLEQDQARKMIASQLSAKEKAARSDFVIKTDSPIEELEPKIKSALARLHKD